MRWKSSGLLTYFEQSKPSPAGRECPRRGRVWGIQTRISFTFAETGAMPHIRLQNFTMGNFESTFSPGRRLYLRWKTLHFLRYSERFMPSPPLGEGAPEGGGCGEYKLAYLLHLQKPGQRPTSVKNRFRSADFCQLLPGEKPLSAVKVQALASASVAKKGADR